MTTRMSLVAVLALIASPVFAQTPPPATDEKAPSMQSEQPAPATPVSPPAVTEPAPAPAPAPQAAAPAPTAAPSAIVASDLRKSDDHKKLVAPLNVAVDAVEDMNILDANGKKIGEVDEVLEDKNGEVKAVAVEYGGFLGFGAKRAIVTLDQVKLKDGNLVTEITEDTLPQQPAWTD